jgi:hypothetical protein
MSNLQRRIDKEDTRKFEGQVDLRSNQVHLEPQTSSDDTGLNLQLDPLGEVGPGEQKFCEKSLTPKGPYKPRLVESVTANVGVARISSRQNCAFNAAKICQVSPQRERPPLKIMKGHTILQLPSQNQHTPSPNKGCQKVNRNADGVLC